MIPDFTPLVIPAFVGLVVILLAFIAAATFVVYSLSLGITAAFG